MTSEGGRSGPEDFATARKEMVRRQLLARGIRDPATLAAMGRVPRESFMPPEHRPQAYADGAAEIGSGQTISQPYIVALMTQALGLDELGWPWLGDRPTFLDVGTGSGYQAAVLAQLGARVVSIERDPELASKARSRLARMAFDVHVIVGDGSRGVPDRAPFAGIVVGAAAPAVPQPLLEQLADGRRLVVPVGSRRLQRLTVVQRLGRSFITSSSDTCVFVPLVGEHGHPR